ncbi:MAG: DJ-1/PfpI family protein [Deltaproteobacteria bacterium]|nr:DJ-1/PfpI family protein [Deltaproteobacteria bacterium]
MTRSACVLLADGFEEIEAITVVDVLRRAGVCVSVLGGSTTGAGAPPRRATGSHGLSVIVDAALVDVVAGGARFDAVVLPGGLPGATNLRDDARVRDFVVGQHAQGAVLAAVCAGPIALARFGLLRGKKATCYPGFEAELTGAVVDTRAAVVVDGDVITSRGVGTSLAFALALVERLVDADAARTLAEKMLVST